MATYVLVPGGWSGGWQLRAVATHLRADGHQVFTPTLTGLGERVHLAHPDVNLATHIQDIVNVIHFEDLTDVILVGYSYSGMVTTAVADRIPEHLAHLIYVDAHVPNDGQSLANILGPQVMTMLREVADQYGDGWRLPHNPPDAPFRTAQPLNTAFQAVHLQHPRALALPRSLIFCIEVKDPADPIMAPIAHAAAHAKAHPPWRYGELPTGHVPWETMPQALARLLHESAQPFPCAA
jgi:pimeloyl-ACP methyl ester carboxylesterase